MRTFLLWALFLSGFFVVFAWWETWPMMLAGAALSVAAHIVLAIEETR